MDNKKIVKSMQDIKDDVLQMIETPKILESGEKRYFEGGAFRDTGKGKGRFDLIPLSVINEYFNLYGSADFELRNHITDPTLNVYGYIDEYMKTNDPSYLSGALLSYINTNYIVDDANKVMARVLLEVSKHFEEGCTIYGENSWKKGIPTSVYVDSALRHYTKYLAGWTDEHHNRAFVWNILCCIWTTTNLAGTYFDSYCRSCEDAKNGK